MNVVAISTTALALLVVGGVLLVQQNVSSLVHRMKSQTTVVTYLEEGVTDEQVDNLRLKINPDDRVADVEFRSKEEALDIFKQRFGNDQDLLEGLSENPLPASLVIRLNPDAIDQVDSLATKVKKMDHVESVDYGEDVVNMVQNISNVAQALLFVIGLIVCLVAIFIIFNTIQLTVVSRETEIDILKLVGATRWFIGFPFVVSGVVQGVVGSLLGTVTLWGLYWVASTRLASMTVFFGAMKFLDWTRVIGLVAFGMILGVIGSGSAVYRTVRDM